MNYPDPNDFTPRARSRKQRTPRLARPERLIYGGSLARDGRDSIAAQARFKDSASGIKIKYLIFPLVLAVAGFALLLGVG